MASDLTRNGGSPESLFGHSERMRAVERVVRQVAATNATVLIEGETGVGKEMVARAIHQLSDRAERVWIKLNCASVPADLLESELFGHERGAFTGAAARKPGRFEMADGGTFFLDEIAEMPLNLQSKILHVLQDNEFFRVGGRDLISVDVRIIAATNRDIRAMVALGTFREDLYYRLNVVNIVVPPLRERREEIPFLLQYFRARFEREFHRPSVDFSPATIELLLAYTWPGNVRELENLIKRYVVLGDEAHLKDELHMRMQVASAQPRVERVAPSTDGIPVGPRAEGGLKDVAKRAARQAEVAAIKEVLDRVRWNRAEAARQLKISYKTLLNKLQLEDFGRKRPSSSKEEK